MAEDKMKLTVGPAPHWRTRYSLAGMHYAWIVALVPAMAATILVQPDTGMKLGVLGLLCLGAATGVLGEYLTQVLFRQSYRALDGHGLLMGLLLTLVLPPTVPAWVLVVGVLVAIVLGKQVYGGIGAYPFHPAMVGVLVLTVSWQHYVYPVDGVTLATGSPLVVYLTAAGGLALTVLYHVRWEVPSTVLLGALAGSLLFGLSGGTLSGALDQLVTGHVILAAFFIAPDPTSSPTNRNSLLLYGFFTGVMITLIRAYGVWPDAIPFAVMLMNVVQPLLDRIRPRVLEVKGHHG